MLKAAEERALVLRAKAGDQKAIQSLIEAHEPLIRKLARVYGKKLEPDDAISEGTAGFLKALPKYDEDSGFRVSTYVRHWITEAIREASYRAPQIRFPRSQRANNGMRAVSSLRSGGHALTPRNLVRIEGLSEAAALDAIARHNHMSQNTYATLDAALDLPDDRIDPAEDIELQKQRNLLQTAAKVLNARERHIFFARTAVNDTPPTLDMLGAQYGVTRERIRQVEQNALKKVMKQLHTMGVMQSPTIQ